MLASLSSLSAHTRSSQATDPCRVDWHRFTFQIATQLSHDLVGRLLFITFEAYSFETAFSMAPPTGFSPFRASSHLPSTCTPGHRPCLHIASIPNPSPKPPWSTRSFLRYALRLVTPLPQLVRSLLPFLWARWARLCGHGCYPYFFPHYPGVLDYTTRSYHCSAGVPNEFSSPCLPRSSIPDIDVFSF